ncbi:aminotransferase class I/II-fold pyridoxal phosphate-dependent enzyme [Xenorhabdus sp. PB30.3]|uniref:aminotransferase class I/II-fold pyridoxal phosphate-dependent enzyme n=1 Tax=Xenorhabdus sp. PB30.3 TaxID=2788941 RepID=UPI001E551641|nr:aminotransferase class I/II-fold pyridoxal phosphate-dependent enzyme [Xenorhabdus sp. PB30.3]MCC8379501.1 aminotransferase class I/II-fold pyridoxal phosphate-dependent enzyme [Xenorhabdus sp. PB30.3]
MQTRIIPLRRQQPNFDIHPYPSITAPEMSLTDQEVLGFRYQADMSSGHAYHDLPPALACLPDEMPAMWRTASHQNPLEWERQLISAFSDLSGVHSLKRLPYCRPCPTASNSIDLCATLLKKFSWRTALIEPTFDNLALILRRRGVPLCAISESMVFDAEPQELQQWLKNNRIDVLFIVSPTNPSGRCLSVQRLDIISSLCTRMGITLALDSSFRLYNRELFDDVDILLRNQTRFIAFEDTGKTIPTLDTKASLIYSSADLAKELEELYNEVYLCCSGLSLALITRSFELAKDAGLENVLWRLVDQRRSRLRSALVGTGLSVAPESMHSVTGLEWLTFDAKKYNDLQVCTLLEEYGIATVSGRQFYWASSFLAEHQSRVRLSMMKPKHNFERALQILRLIGNQGSLFYRSKK